MAGRQSLAPVHLRALASIIADGGYTIEAFCSATGLRPRTALGRIAEFRRRHWLEADGVTLTVEGRRVAGAGGAAPAAPPLARAPKREVACPDPSDLRVALDALPGQLSRILETWSSGWGPEFLAEVAGTGDAKLPRRRPGSRPSARDVVALVELPAGLVRAAVRIALLPWGEAFLRRCADPARPRRGGAELSTDDDTEDASAAPPPVRTPQHGRAASSVQTHFRVLDKSGRPRSEHADRATALRAYASDPYSRDVVRIADGMTILPPGPRPERA